MPQKQINGVSLYYEQAGEGEQTLVLIHGNVASRRWWDLVWQPLAAKHTVVRVDLRGNGLSESSGEGQNVPQYSADVRALLHELGVEEAVIIGHSMGGAIAMDIAATEPDLVSGLVLLNSAPVAGIVTPEERFPLIEMMVKDRNLMKMALAAVIPTAASGEFFEQLVDDAMIAGPTMVPNSISLGVSDYRAALANTTLPTLILYGDQDSIVSKDMVLDTHAQIPGSELVLYEGIGHSPNVEAPERFLADVEAFVSRLSEHVKH